MSKKLGLTVVFSVFEFAALALDASLKECLELLHGEMKCEPHLLHPPVSEMQKSFESNNACIVFKLDHGLARPVAFARLVPLVEESGNAWFEFGTVFVSQAYRNEGIGTMMYKIFVTRHENAGKRILATTTNRAALAVGKKCGFVLWQRKDLPEVVWRTSCICETAKTGPLGQENCQIAHGECNGSSLVCYFRLSPKTDQFQRRS